MKKKVAILFSGGLDSTYLVWKNLKEGNIVLPIYITLENNSNKVKMETFATDRLWNMFRKEFGGPYIEKIERPIKIKVESWGSLSSVQPPLWITGMLFSNLRGCDEVQIGYVMNDCALSYLNEMKSIFNTYKSFMDDDCKNIELEFPIIKEHKHNIVKKLPENYRELTVWCENPNILKSNDDDVVLHKDCEYCVPCETMKRHSLFYKWERNEYVKSETVPMPMPIEAVEFNPNQLEFKFENSLIYPHLEEVEEEAQEVK